MKDLGFRITRGATVKELPLRIRRIDCSEIYRPKDDAELEAARAAKAYAESLLLGRELTFWTHPDPQVWGRWVGDIRLPDGSDFATAMVENGHAEWSEEP